MTDVPVCRTTSHTPSVVGRAAHRRQPHAGRQLLATARTAPLLNAPCIFDALTDLPS